MDEELLKRNTDCVYFLASPFTCKKGAECEYRHSDMARLNPRDCWYWLSGNCLNPTCPFRHPPLEVHNEVSTEVPASVLNQSSVPATKTTVPCYFYYNGFCNKGDRCPFLHKPDDTFASKPKIASAGGNALVLPLDSKTSGGRDTGPTSAVKHPCPFEMPNIYGNALQVQQKQQAQQSANVPDQKTYLQSYVPEFDETHVEAMSLQPAEGSTKSDCDPSLGSGQSSEELIDDNVVRDDWLESSPGFDVLVDGQTEDMAFEDDPDYSYAVDGNGEDHERLFMQHGFVGQTEYDERGFFRDGIYEGSEHFNNELRPDRERYSPRPTRDRKASHIVARNRKFRGVESAVSGFNSVDLRDYLRKRRMADGYLDTHALRHDLVHGRDDRHERLRRHPAIQRLHGRIASKVERNSVGFGRRRPSLFNAEQRGRPRNSQHNGYRHCNEIRRRHSSTEGQLRSYSKRERYAKESITFGRPKSLPKFQEEMRHGYYSKNGSVDFEGPKPLCELLKDKRKTASEGGAMICSS